MVERCRKPDAVIDPEVFALRMQHLVLGVKSRTFALGNIKIGDILNEVLSMVRNHHVRLAPCPFGGTLGQAGVRRHRGSRVGASASCDWTSTLDGLNGHFVCLSLSQTAPMCTGNANQSREQRI